MLLNGAFSASLAKFVENTGIQLNITDVGWAPLRPLLGGLPGHFTLVDYVDRQRYHACDQEKLIHLTSISFDICTCLSLVFDQSGMLTTTVSCQGVSLFVATLPLSLVGVMKIINSDLMKPTFDDLLNAPVHHL